VVGGPTAPRRRLVPSQFTGWAGSWHAFSYGATAIAFVLAAPVAVPTGLLIASWAWQVRIYRIETGLAGVTATRRSRSTTGNGAARPGPLPARTPPPAWCR
jgi:hypothetical protein